MMGWIIKLRKRINFHILFKCAAVEFSQLHLSKYNDRLNNFRNECPLEALLLPQDLVVMKLAPEF